MSAYTSDDIKAAVDAWAKEIDFGATHYHALRRVVAAVAPAIAARALREAAQPDEVDDIEGTPIRDADETPLLWLHQPRQISEWLRDRANEIERTT